MIFNFKSLVNRIFNKADFEKEIFGAIKENLSQSMLQNRVTADSFQPFFEAMNYEQYKNTPTNKQLPIFPDDNKIDTYEQSKFNFFTTNIKEISRIRRRMPDPDKKVKAKITITTPDTIKSIIMGQATGIHRWDIKKYELAQNQNHKLIPMYARTGTPKYRVMSKASKGWIYPSKPAMLLPNEIIRKTKNTLEVKVTLRKLEQILEKMGRFGTVHIKY